LSCAALSGITKEKKVKGKGDKKKRKQKSRTKTKKRERDQRKERNSEVLASFVSLCSVILLLA